MCRHQFESRTLKGDAQYMPLNQIEEQIRLAYPSSNGFFELLQIMFKQGFPLLTLSRHFN